MYARRYASLAVIVLLVAMSNMAGAVSGFVQKVGTEPAPFETAPEETGPPQGERLKYVHDLPPTARPEEPPSSGGVSKGAHLDFLGKALRRASAAPRPYRYFGDGIQNLVFMGMGEPLDNFDNVIQAIRVFN